MSWFFCMVRKVSCLQIINPLEIENLWCCGRILLWFSRCRTMINFVCEQKESYSASTVRWQELSFVQHLLYALSLVENNFLQMLRTGGKEPLPDCRTRVLILLVTARFLYLPTVPQTERRRCWAVLWLMFSVWDARGGSKAIRCIFLQLVSCVKLGRSLLFLCRWPLYSSKCQTVC